MNAGNLRERVTLEKPTHTTNKYGETDVDWEAFREVWAEVTPLKGWQVERARQVQMNTTHRVRIRYAPEVAGDWRIRWGDHVLNIVGIVPDPRKEELELSCEQEGVPAA